MNTNTNRNTFSKNWSNTNTNTSKKKVFENTFQIQILFKYTSLTTKKNKIKCLSSTHTVLELLVGLVRDEAAHAGLDGQNGGHLLPEVVARQVGAAEALQVGDLGAQQVVPVINKE